MNTNHEGMEETSPELRTAVLIVAGEDSAPDRAFEAIRSRFGDYYDQIIFLSIGLVDYQVIDDVESAKIGTYVRTTARGAVTTCIEQARKAGMAAVTCVAIGTDPVTEVEKHSVEFAQKWPHVMFFLGKIVFERERWYHSLLHGRTADAIQRKLERRGLPVAILPIVV